MTAASVGEMQLKCVTCLGILLSFGHSSSTHLSFLSFYSAHSVCYLRTNSFKTNINERIIPLETGSAASRRGP